MGKIKYINKVESLLKKSPVVDFNSINKITNNKNYTNQLINYLIKKGKIIRLTKGYYTIYNDASLIVYCFKPSYLGLQDALSFFDIWEQETTPIIISSMIIIITFLIQILKRHS